MKKGIYSFGAMLVISFAMPAAAQEGLTRSQGTLLVLESPDLFVTSPAGVELSRVSHSKPIGWVGFISDSRSVMVLTRDEDEKPIIEKITLTGEVLGRYSDPQGMFPPSFSPDGTQLLYRDIEGNLIGHNIESNINRTIFKPSNNERVLHPTMSPNRTTVAFSLSVPGAKRVRTHLCLMQLDQQLQRDGCVGERIISPSFSSDGTKLAYWEQTKQFPDHIWSLIVREIFANGKLGALTIVLSQKFKGEFDDVRIGPIGWSPDSQWLMWSLRSDRSSPFFGLFRTRIATGETQEVPIKRSWWTTFWREYLLPSDKNRFAFNFHWMP
jgi:Tol biopolymer transport system component